MRHYTVLVLTRSRTCTVYEVCEGVSKQRGQFPSEEEARTYATAENLPNIRTLFECVVCGQQQFDHFMVLNHLWRRAGLGRGSIHFRCLEQLIGRPLTQHDFTDVPMNAPIKFGYQMGLRDAVHTQFEGHARCRACEHSWQTVVDLQQDLYFLTCPACHEQAGEM